MLRVRGAVFALVLILAFWALTGSIVVAAPFLLLRLLILLRLRLLILRRLSPGPFLLLRLLLFFGLLGQRFLGRWPFGLRSFLCPRL